MNVDSTQNIISFCSGYGGIELGIKRTGLDVRTVAYVEIEAFATANLVAKIEQGKMDAAPIWSNLKTFDGRPFRGKVHGIIGGYPCQPFSNAGQRKGTGDPRHLFPYICEHIRTVNPLWCFFENVGGHLNLGFDEVYKSLRDLGYSVEAGLFTAAEVGAPHKRERLFILAHAERCRWSTRGNPRQGNTDKRNGSENRQQRKQSGIGTSKASELGNTKRNRLNRQAIPVLGRRSHEESIDVTGAGEGKLAIASSKRTGSINRQAGRGNRSSVLRQGNGETCTGGVTAASELADNRGIHAARADKDGADGERFQELPRQSSLRNEDSGCSENYGRWPARPGQPQYDWEEPRTVESGMGRTVDGFAGRVDELRLLGNGVVPQTAELAFRTLWNKTI